MFYTTKKIMITDVGQVQFRIKTRYEKRVSMGIFVVVVDLSVMRLRFKNLDLKLFVYKKFQKIKISFPPHNR